MYRRNVRRKLNQSVRDQENNRHGNRLVFFAFIAAAIFVIILLIAGREILDIEQDQAVLTIRKITATQLGHADEYTINSKEYLDLPPLEAGAIYEVCILSITRGDRLIDTFIFTKDDTIFARSSKDREECYNDSPGPDRRVRLEILSNDTPTPTPQFAIQSSE
jgi:hypothetical protein